jgi:hypothetical protein
MRKRGGRIVKLRKAMAQHGFREVSPNIYSRGDIHQGKMAVIAAKPKPDMGPEEIATFALWVVEAYDELVKNGPLDETGARWKMTGLMQ